MRMSLVKNKNISENSSTKKEGTRKRGLRMKDLMAATGLPKSAILHYLAQGLLPEPEKTGPNMAYYEPSFIERIKFIKDIQGKYSFPLSKIRMLLNLRDRGKDITQLVELSRVIFAGDDSPSMDEKTFCSASGLSRKQVRELMDNRLLLPMEQGCSINPTWRWERYMHRGSRRGSGQPTSLFTQDSQNCSWTGKCAFAC